MRALIDIAIIITLLFGGKYALPKIHFIIKKEVLTNITQGLPPLNPYSAMLTGKKSRF